MHALRRLLSTRPVLLLAFAFAVMGDPVSSVAYAIEAALRALDGRLALLLQFLAHLFALLLQVFLHFLLPRFELLGIHGRALVDLGEIAKRDRERDLRAAQIDGLDA